MKDKELEKLGKYQLLKEEIWDHKGQFKKGLRRQKFKKSV